MTADVDPQRELAPAEPQAPEAQRAAEGVCCDIHGRNCEPPSELCCRDCIEAAHDTFPIRHADGSTCSAPDPQRELAPAPVAPTEPAEPLAPKRWRIRSYLGAHFIWSHVSFVDRTVWWAGSGQEFPTLAEVEEFDGPLFAVVENLDALLADLRQAEAYIAELEAAATDRESGQRGRDKGAPICPSCRRGEHTGCTWDEAIPPDRCTCPCPGGHPPPVPGIDETEVSA